MNFWTAALIVVLLFLAAALLPRVYIRGEFGKDRLKMQFWWLWFAVKTDLKEKKSYVRILFFTIQPKDAPQKKPPKPKEKTPPDEAKIAEPVEKTEEFKEEHTREEPAYEKEAFDYEKAREPKTAPPRADESKFEPEPQEPEDEQQKLGFSFYWDERKLLLKVLHRIVAGIIHFVSAARIDYLNAAFTYGANDPMATGIIYGVIQNIRILNGKRVKFDIVPVFNGAFAEFDLSCSFSMRPLMGALVIAREIFLFPWFGVVRFGIRAWKAKRAQ